MSGLQPTPREPDHSTRSSGTDHTRIEKTAHSGDPELVVPQPSAIEAQYKEISKWAGTIRESFDLTTTSQRSTLARIARHAPELLTAAVVECVITDDDPSRAAKLIIESLLAPDTGYAEAFARTLGSFLATSYVSEDRRGDALVRLADSRDFTDNARALAFVELLSGSSEAAVSDDAVMALLKGSQGRNSTIEAIAHNWSRLSAQAADAFIFGCFRSPQTAEALLPFVTLCLESRGLAAHKLLGVFGDHTGRYVEHLHTLSVHSDSSVAALAKAFLCQPTTPEANAVASIRSALSLPGVGAPWLEEVAEVLAKARSPELLSQAFIAPLNRSVKLYAHIHRLLPAFEALGADALPVLTTLAISGTNADLRNRGLTPIVLSLPRKDVVGWMEKQDWKHSSTREAGWAAHIGRAFLPESKDVMVSLLEHPAMEVRQMVCRRYSLKENLGSDVIKAVVSIGIEAMKSKHSETSSEGQLLIEALEGRASVALHQLYLLHKSAPENLKERLNRTLPLINSWYKAWFTLYGITG